MKNSVDPDQLASALFSCEGIGFWKKDICTVAY